MGFQIENLGRHLYARGSLAHCLRIGRTLSGSYRNLNAKGAWGLYI